MPWPGGSTAGAERSGGRGTAATSLERFYCVRFNCEAPRHRRGRRRWPAALRIVPLASLRYGPGASGISYLLAPETRLVCRGEGSLRLMDERVVHNSLCSRRCTILAGSDSTVLALRVQET